MTDTEWLAKARAIATDPRCYREWYITDEDGEEYPVSGFNVPGLEDLIYAGLREAEALGQAEAEAQRDKLQAFKDWVHAYLDSKGITSDPGGSHSVEGCRIGDRLDLVFGMIDALTEAELKIREECLQALDREKAARAEEREACEAELQSLLDGDFCGSDIEALEAGITAIRSRGADPAKGG